MYMAKPGHVLYAADYSQVELCTLAETCLEWLGKSVMADVINSGVDLHRWFAGRVLNKEPEEVTKEERMMAKACNFGFPGGMGVRSFRSHAKTAYGVTLTHDEAENLREEWLSAYPEMQAYFNSIRPSTKKVKPGEAYEKWYIGRTITGRVRERSTFCAACNAPFQGLAADGAKVAMYILWLNRMPMVAFIHDEILFELPRDDNLASTTRRINKIMLNGMKQVVKRVKIKIEGALMYRWDKAAEPVYDEKGNLRIWHPENI